MPRPQLPPKRRRPQGIGGERNGGPAGSGAGGSSSSSSSSTMDPFHNRDQPCCQELSRICQQVLQAGSTPASSTSSSSSSSAIPTLPELVWAYLVELSRATAPAVHRGPAATASNGSDNGTPEASAGAKKKRKKKKAKKKAKEQAAEDGEEHADDGAADGDDEAAPPEEREGGGAAPLAAAASAAAPPPPPDEAGRSSATTTTSTFPSPQTRPRSRSLRSAKKPPTLFDRMVHDCFFAAASAATAESSADSARQAQARDFWRFVDRAAAASSASSAATAGKNGSTSARMRRDVPPSPVVSEAALRNLRSRVACGKCRDTVIHLLDTEQRFVLYRPATPLVPSEHAYELMEEGALDQAFAWRLQQQRELAFCLSVGGDGDEENGSSGEMVWKLRGMGFGEGHAAASSDNALLRHDGGDDYVEDERGEAHQPLDWRRVILYNYVLARGISPGDLMRGAVVPSPPTLPDASSEECRGPILKDLDPTVVRGMANAVQSTLLGHQSVFRDSASALEQLFKTLGKHPSRGGSHGDHLAAALTESTNIDMVAFAVFKEIDEACCKLMGELMDLLLELTQSLFVAYSAASEHSPAWRKRDVHDLQETVLHLWDYWLEIVQGIVHDISCYEGYTRNLTDRHGQYPQPFFSSTYREVYRALVKQKLTCAYQVLEKFRKVADLATETPGMNPEDHKSTVHRKLYTYSVFCRHSLGMDYKRDVSLTPLDEEMKGVLKSVLECITTPIKASWQQVQLEHEHRSQRLLRRCERVFLASSNQQQQIQSLQGTISQLLTGSSHEEPLSDPTGVGNGDDGEIDASSSPYQSHLKEALMPLLRAWFMEQRQYWMLRSAIGCIPLMPAPLLRTMVYENEDHHCFQRGHTRAACLFVVLLYRWLSEVHDVWRAEVAEQDLLKSMSSLEAESALVDGGPDVTASAGSKGKHGKKKKKTKKIDLPTAEPPNATSTDVIQSKSTSVAPAVNGVTGAVMQPHASGTPAKPNEDLTISEKPDLPMRPSKSTGLAFNCDAPSAELSSTDDINDEKFAEDPGLLPRSNEVRNGKTKRNDTVKVDESGRSASNGKPVYHPSLEYLAAIDECVKIGVEDASGYQTAEDFLVGRLTAVLQQRGS